MDAGEFGGERAPQIKLVVGVAVGVQQRHGDRLDLRLASLAGQPASVGGGEGSSGPSGVIRSRAPKRSSVGTSGAGRAVQSR